MLTIETKNDFDSLIQNIARCLKLYEKNKYTQRYFQLMNGDSIVLSFPSSTIPHLLGINTVELNQIPSIKRRSYQAVTDLIEQSYSVYQKIQQQLVHPNRIFSSYTLEKLKNFPSILYCDSKKIFAFCKYDNKRSYYLEREKNYPDGYYIILEEDNQTFRVLGIKNMYQNNYQPHTNLIFHSIEELRDLLYGQEVTLPYQYHVRKEIREIPIFYPNDQKQEKIKHLIQYQAQIPFSINVTKECLNSLKILSENKTKENETNALLQELNQKETIDEEDISFLASLLNKDLFSFVDRLWSQPLINEESYYQNVSEKQKLIQELEETK